MNKAWVVEVFSSGVWWPIVGSLNETRKKARRERKDLSCVGGAKYRIRRWVREESK